MYQGNGQLIDSLTLCCIAALYVSQIFDKEMQKCIKEVMGTSAESNCMCV